MNTSKGGATPQVKDSVNVETYNHIVSSQVTLCDQRSQLIIKQVSSVLHVKRGLEISILRDARYLGRRNLFVGSSPQLDNGPVEFSLYSVLVHEKRDLCLLDSPRLALLS